MIPLSHLVHLRELMCVPSSVGSAQRAQSHSKNLLRLRCSLRSMVGSKVCAYEVYRVLPLVMGTAARTTIL